MEAISVHQQSALPPRKAIVANQVDGLSTNVRGAEELRQLTGEFDYFLLNDHCNSIEITRTAFLQVECKTV